MLKTRKNAYKIVMELRKKESLGRRRLYKRLKEFGYNIPSGTIQNWLKGRKPTLKEFNVNKELTEEKAYILGVVGPGDGYITNTAVGLAVTDKDFAEKFRNCLEKVYGFKCKFKKEKPSGLGKKFRYRVTLCSVNVVKDFEGYNVSFKENNWRIPDVIKKGSKKIKSEYISGFCDSQGSVGERKIKISSKNETGLKEMISIFEDIGLRVSLNKDGLSILGRISLELYYNEIRFSIQRKQDKLFSLINNYKRYFVPSTEIDKLIPDIKKYLNIGYSQRKIARLLNISQTGVRNRMKYYEVIK